MTRILIVEDNEKNLKLFQIIIESLGYETLLAKNGEEGVRMAKEQIPDLIIMDIQMPVMDGISTLKVLRSNKKTKDIPVIALTSYAMKGDKERLLEIGFIDYISKPISKDSFIEVVEKVLGRKHGDYKA
jgi:two-component system cell cycle response regulator DivK